MQHVDFTNQATIGTHATLWGCTWSCMESPPARIHKRTAASGQHTIGPLASVAPSMGVCYNQHSTCKHSTFNNQTSYRIALKHATQENVKHVQQSTFNNGAIMKHSANKRLIHGPCDYALFAFDGKQARYVHVTLDGSKDEVERFSKNLLFEIIERMVIEENVPDNSYVTFTTKDVLAKIYKYILALAAQGE